MRVAALYDIHGNLPALEAVLDDVRRCGVDRIVVGGDVVPGPMVAETLAFLAAAGIPLSWIYGNGEAAVLAQRAGREPAAVPQQYRPVIRWHAEHLDDKAASFIASWPLTVTLDIAGVGAVLFCHATPRDDNEIFTERTAVDRLLPVFAGVNADVVVCGHTHMPFDRQVGRVRVVNAGSLGMPWGAPGADWLLLGPAVEMRHTDYDLEAAAGRIRSCGHPEAGTFADEYVLHRPSREQMLEVCARVELH